MQKYHDNKKTNYPELHFELEQEEINDFDKNWDNF